MTSELLKQDAVIGGLLGLCIGDAMGFPFRGQTESEIRRGTREPGNFYAISFEDETSLEAGEFSDKSEIALCIVESYTVNNGIVDPENIRPRLEMLANGESRRWLERGSLEALTTEPKSNEEWGRTELPPGGDVAVRGVPLGLILAGRDARAIPAEEVALSLAQLTHGSPDAGNLVNDVALAIQVAATRKVGLETLPGHLADLVRDRDSGRRLAEIQESVDRGWRAPRVEAQNFRCNPGRAAFVEAVALAASHEDFHEGVTEAVRSGGVADTRAALVGALLGSHLGTQAIPQELIDGLEGRMYVLLAGPWFYRTIQLRSGLVPVVQPNSDHTRRGR